MSYSKRTCTVCGFRDIQPNMTQKTVKSKSGQSKAGAGLNTWAGYLLGDKSSVKAVNRTIWGTNTRNYTRNKQVWVCNRSECSGSGDGSGGGFFSAIWSFIKSFLIWSTVCVGFFIIFFLLGAFL